MYNVARRAGRAHQLDAARLDDELQTVLHAHGARALRYFGAETWRAIAPEAALALRVAIWYRTTRMDAATPALAYCNLRYARGSNAHGAAGRALSWTQKHMLIVISAFVPWAHTRLSRLPAYERPLRSCVALLHAARAINALLFARYSRYRSLTDRLAAASLRYSDLDATRAPPLEVLHRAFVWRGVAAIALFLAPVGPALRAAIRRTIARPSSSQTARRAGCASCDSTRMCMPHRAIPCECDFCYVCVATLGESLLNCPRCNVPINHAMRTTA